MAMMVFKKAMPRRTFLRGAGGMLALPFLDAMVPAFAAPAAMKAPTRLGIAFVGNGMWPMSRWTPAKEGKDFEMSPAMEPLKEFRDQILVISGLASKEAFPKADDPTGEHMRASTTFLSGVRPRQLGGQALGGITMDQIAAQKFSKETQLPSLELALMANHELVGSCENNLSCLFVDTLSWRAPSSPVPVENNPRAVFERLFGDVNTTNRAEQIARMHQQRSILDGLLQQASDVLKVTDAADRAKINEYLESIRDIERRIQIAEASNKELPPMDRPIGVPATFDEYAKLMIDMQVMAYQADLTRVITFMFAREGPTAGLNYPQLGFADNHHSLSHHQDDPMKVEKLFKINLYHAKLFAYYLQKMKSTADGNGSLLDHTMFIYGSSLSNPNGHQCNNLPILLAGGGNGAIKGGRHIRFPENTALTNLHLALLDKLGVPTEKLGDSNGQLNLLPV
jgi:uncharacterized protein DUF1552